MNYNQSRSSAILTLQNIIMIPSDAVILFVTFLWHRNKTLSLSFTLAQPYCNLSLSRLHPVSGCAEDSRVMFFSDINDWSMTNLYEYAWFALWQVCSIHRTDRKKRSVFSVKWGTNAPTLALPMMPLAKFSWEVFLCRSLCPDSFFTGNAIQLRAPFPLIYKRK